MDWCPRPYPACQSPLCNEPGPHAGRPLQPHTRSHPQDTQPWGTDFLPLPTLTVRTPGEAGGTSRAGVKTGYSSPACAPGQGPPDSDLGHLPCPLPPAAQCPASNERTQLPTVPPPVSCKARPDSDPGAASLKWCLSSWGESNWEVGLYLHLPRAPCREGQVSSPSPSPLQADPPLQVGRGDRAWPGLRRAGRGPRLAAEGVGQPEETEDRAPALLLTPGSAPHRASSLQQLGKVAPRSASKGRRCPARGHHFRAESSGEGCLLPPSLPAPIGYDCALPLKLTAGQPALCPPAPR